ncbi:MAG: hypothetical protein RR357_01180 [Clostridia bacterium]
MENHLSNCNDENSTCTSIFSQFEDVSVAIKLNTFAKLGDLSTKCCGEPTVCVNCCKRTNGLCGYEIVITQTVCTRIPIEYCTCADISSTTVNCDDCNNCK